MTKGAQIGSVPVCTLRCARVTTMTSGAKPLTLPLEKATTAEPTL